MKKLLFAFLAISSICLSFPLQAQAIDGSVLGIHILNPSEADSAESLLNNGNQNQWHYVTIPLTLNDLSKHDEWQNFFNDARNKKLIPVVRLATKFENGAWQIPTKKNVVDLISFLSELNWPTDQRYIIAFNEVNHAKEWGGSINPAEYAETLRFTSDWAKSEDKNYQVLPAAMDLAAPNGGETEEAFAYLDDMRKSNGDIFNYVDYWNSHSYPNGFSASPEDVRKNSVRGFTYELSYLKDKTGRDFRTFITETGWIDNAATHPWLNSYYQYAAERIWSDPRVVAVTPFVLRGDPGPFSGFTFLNRNDQPTEQYRAYQNLIKKVAENK